jgi:hypothetical protein
MKGLELFSGSGEMSNTWKAHNWDTCSIDVEAAYKPDICADIRVVTAEQIIESFGHPDVIWSSPPCERFSVAAFGKTWPHGIPNIKTLEAIDVHIHALKLIFELDPKYYFIENPRGLLRKMSWMQGLPLYTVTYCQYGDNRMKPTDIWTNHPAPGFKPMCHNGDSCHESAPRGSRTGTQGRDSYYARSMVPSGLCEHIVDICEHEPKNVTVMKQKLLIEA